MTETEANDRRQTDVRNSVPSAIMLVCADVPARPALRSELAAHGILTIAASTTQALTAADANTAIKLGASAAVIDWSAPVEASCLDLTQIVAACTPLPCLVLAEARTASAVKLLADTRCAGIAEPDLDATQLVTAIHAVQNGAGWLAPRYGGLLLHELRTMQTLRNRVTQTLSARECEILLLIARGFDNAQIASTIGTARSTANHHVAHILQKLMLHSRAQAAALAVAAGLFDPACDDAEIS